MAARTKLLSKRKKLAQRCPKCDSSQIYYRKFMKNYKCKCGNVFKTPKSDG